MRPTLTILWRQWRRHHCHNSAEFARYAFSTREKMHNMQHRRHKQQAFYVSEGIPLLIANVVIIGATPDVSGEKLMVCRRCRESRCWKD
ncbi:MAG: hypothetical protein H0X30_02215 [Anaerolineae bacterium]|nr:hypothetical protein [Anaerolineae bacterium]